MNDHRATDMLGFNRLRATPALLILGKKLKIFLFLFRRHLTPVWYETSGSQVAKDPTLNVMLTWLRFHALGCWDLILTKQINIWIIVKLTAVYSAHSHFPFPRFDSFSCLVFIPFKNHLYVVTLLTSVGISWIAVCSSFELLFSSSFELLFIFWIDVYSSFE